MADISGFHDDVYDAVKTYVTANWNYTDLQWPNTPYDPIQGSPYVKFEMTGSDYEQVSIGAEIQATNRWDREGLLWFYVIVPKGTDFSNASGAAKALAKLFRGKTLIQGLEFGSASINPTDNSNDSPWFVVPLSIEWRQIDSQ